MGVEHGKPGLPGEQGKPGPIVNQSDVGFPSQGGQGGRGGRGGDASRSRPVFNAVRLLILATVLLYLSVAGVGVFFYFDGKDRREKIARVAYDSARAMCALREDQERRLRVTREYLNDHPNGTDDISLGVLRQSIDNSEKTLKALRFVDCPAKVPPG